MNIVTVTSSFPYPPDDGTKIQCFERIRELSHRHRVTLLCISSEPVTSDRIREMERYCSWVLLPAPPLRTPRTTAGKAWQMIRSLWLREPYYLHDAVAPEGLAWLEREVESQRIDVVDADAGAIPYLSAPNRALKVAVLHGVTDATAKQELALAVGAFEKLRILVYSTLIRRFEARLLRSVDLWVTLTEDGRRQFLRLHPDAPVRHCLSNGVDLEYFSFAAPERAPRGVCFVGRMDYKPNVDAVLWFYHQIFPLIRQRLPHLRFSVVGGHPPEAIRSLESDPAVDVTGYVDDIRPHVRACGLVVLPIRICSGILNKLLQSLALGVPVVATNMSLEGLDVVSDRDLLVADSPEAIADGLVRLATDQDLRLRLTSSGRAYVERVHQWSTMVAGYEEELKSRLRTPDTASGHTTPVFARASRRLS